MLPSDGTTSAGAVRWEQAMLMNKKGSVWVEQNENRGGCDMMVRQEGAR